MFGKPIVAICSVFFAAAAAPAQLAQSTEAKAGGFVLEAGQIELQELVDKAAGFLGWNILVNEMELQNSAVGGAGYTLQNRSVTDREGCEDLFTTMLATKGFAVRALDQGKGLYEVIAMNGPRARELFTSPPQKTPEQILSRPNLRIPVATTVQLQHINATVASNTLRPFYASVGGPGTGIMIGNVGNAGTLLISGMQNEVANAIAMLRDSDVPSPVEGTAGLAQEVESLKKRMARLEKELAKLRKK